MDLDDSFHLLILLIYFNYTNIQVAPVLSGFMTFEKFSGEEGDLPKQIIKNNIPSDLKHFALEIDDSIERIFDDNYSSRKSGRGITYFVGDISPGSAFVRISPTRSNNFLRVFFDPSAKKSVNSSPMKVEELPLSRPAYETINKSFRLYTEIHSHRDIDSNLEEIILTSHKKISN